MEKEGMLKWDRLSCSKRGTSGPFTFLTQSGHLPCAGKPRVNLEAPLNSGQGQPYTLTKGSREAGLTKGRESHLPQNRAPSLVPAQVGAGRQGSGPANLGARKPDRQAERFSLPSSLAS